MKSTNLAKIEVLLDKLNILLSNVKESNEDWPFVEIKLMQKYSRELNDFLSNMDKNEISEPESQKASTAAADIENTLRKMKEKDVAAESKKESDSPSPSPYTAPTSDEQSLKNAENEEKISRLSQKEESQLQNPVIKPTPKAEPEKQIADRIIFEDIPSEPLPLKEEPKAEVAGPTVPKGKETTPEEDRLKPDETPKPQSQPNKLHGDKEITPKPSNEEVKQQAKILTKIQAQQKVENDKEQQDSSLNARFKRSESDLAQKLVNKPIADLKNDIGLNEKFWFINNLFEGDGEEFRRVINIVNNMDSFEEAKGFIDNELMDKYKWKEEDSATQKFINLIKRRFL